MPTDFIDEEIGSAVVKKSFQTRVNPNRAKEGGIGGCAIQSGIIKKDHHFRIYRKNECIYEGTFSVHPIAQKNLIKTFPNPTQNQILVLYGWVRYQT